MNIRRIGLDLAKNVFTVCGVDEHGQVVVKKTLRREQVLAWFAQVSRSLVGMGKPGRVRITGRGS